MQGLPVGDDDNVIAFVRCDFADADLQKQFMPSWVRLLDGKRILTTHQANAWVMSEDLAEEVAETCNNSPEWQTIQFGAGNLQSSPIPVKYVVVKYRLVQNA